MPIDPRRLAYAHVEQPVAQQQGYGVAQQQQQQVPYGAYGQQAAAAAPQQQPATGAAPDSDILNVRGKTLGFCLFCRAFCRLSNILFHLALGKPLGG